MSLVEFKNASFSYDGNAVVSGLNFAVERGDYLCVVGENGSGKSTLLKGLLRLKTPSTGSIDLDKDVKAKEIGFLPQQTASAKDFPASVYEVVLSGRLASCGLRPFYGRKDRETAARNMSRLGISDLRDRCYRELSGGQKQRVLLARALCAAEKLLLLDEPVAGLDPMITQELYRQISQINRELGITVIMVSHDIQSAVKYAGKILHLKNTQAYYGRADEYVNTAIGAEFLGKGGCHCCANVN